MKFLCKIEDEMHSVLKLRDTDDGYLVVVKEDGVVFVPFEATMDPENVIVYTHRFSVVMRFN